MPDNFQRGEPSSTFDLRKALESFDSSQDKTTPATKEQSGAQARKPKKGMGMLQPKKIRMTRTWSLNDNV